LHREEQELGRLKQIELLLQQQRIGAEGHVFLARHKTFHDLADLAGEVWETGRDKIEGGWLIHREQRVSNKDARSKLGILGIEALRMRDIGKRMSDAMMELGWTKVAGTLVCKRGNAPEGGYRRSIPDGIELDEQQPRSATPHIRQKGQSAA